jgi:hypothetical protein
LGYSARGWSCAVSKDIWLNLKMTWRKSHFENTNTNISTSLNSDDPPFFATTVGAEYQSGAKDFGLDIEQLRSISRMAMQASFADVQTKARLLAIIG